MTARVSIIDYDCGNLKSVARALEYCGASVELLSETEDIAKAQRLILPGVGAFGRAMTALRKRGLFDPIRVFATSGRPFLGICLGMQLMFSASEEFGETAGLDLLPGRVRAITDHTTDGRQQKIPHIGWNAIHPASGAASWDGTIMAKIKSETPVYFVHSYEARPEAPEDLLAWVGYGGHKITAAVRHGNMTGCQFHPEKSGEVGLQILRNFISHD